MRGTGVRTSRCPTLTDPSWQIRPSAQQHPHHTGRPGFPDIRRCSLHSGPGHRAARSRLFTRILRPRPVQEGGGPVFSDASPAPEGRVAATCRPGQASELPECLLFWPQGRGPGLLPPGTPLSWGLRHGPGGGARGPENMACLPDSPLGTTGASPRSGYGRPIQGGTWVPGSGSAAPRRLSEGVPVGGDQPR